MPVQMHYHIIGKNIKECRKAAHLTQEELAEQAGIGQQFLSRLERGKGIPSLETIMALCDALHVEPNKLLTRSATHDDALNRLRSDYAAFADCLSDNLSAPEADILIVIHPDDLPALDIELPDSPFDEDTP